MARFENLPARDCALARECVRERAREYVRERVFESVVNGERELRAVSDGT